MDDTTSVKKAPLSFRAIRRTHDGGQVAQGTTFALKEGSKTLDELQDLVGCGEAFIRADGGYISSIQSIYKANGTETWFIKTQNSTYELVPA
jgi:hypothetical protein